MRLSIVVPVYNMAGDGKLNYCMDSLVKQTITDYEIIAVDDASTDHSFAVLQEYERNYPGLVKAIQSPENRRQGGAKNIGIKAAVSEWIGFIDSDDWITPDMYEKLLRKADETGADVVGCDYNLVQEHTMQVGKVVQNNTEDQTGVLGVAQYRKLIMRSGSMVIKIFKRNIIIKNELWFPEHIFYEDNYASPLWMMHCKHFEKVNEPMYYYYQHDTSTVHSISEARCEDRMKAAELFLEACQKTDWMDMYREEIEYRFTELYFVNTLFSYMQGEQSKHISFIRKMAKKMKLTYPLFEQNHYYQELVNEEQKKFIRCLKKSTIFFFVYYELLFFYRKIRQR